MIAIKENVLCICRGCQYETNNSGKYVSIATRIRHRRRDKKFKNNYIPPNIPLHNNDIITSSRAESTNISEDNDQNDSPEIMEVSSNSELTSIINDNNQNEPINENTLYSSSSEKENNEVEDNEEGEDNNEEYDSNSNKGYNNNSNEEYDNEECDDHNDDEYIDDEEYDTNGKFDKNDEEYDSDQEEDNSRYEYTSSEKYVTNNGKIGDVFDGDRYKFLAASAGVTCYDAVLQETFILRSHILSCSSDIPALSKVICLSGHNAYYGCHFYYLCEIYSSTAKHIYFPLQPPRGYNGTNYNPNNLPMRSYTSYLQDIEAVENRGRVRNRIIHEQGVNGHSILLELQSIDFPTSFSIDIMHALFENIAPHMFRHFNEKFFNNEELNDTNYKISSDSWNEITKIIEQNRKNMPMGFGRPPINILKYHSAFKAEDWYNWIVLYSLPLLHNYLPIRHINGWARFVRMTQLCLELTISRFTMGNMAIFDREKVLNIFQKGFPLEHTFSFSNTGEKLHPLFQKYNITDSEIRKVITKHIQKYDKLQTESGAKLLVDKNAHLSRAPVDFKEHEFYSQILYYFVHELNNELSMLAFVQWIKTPEKLSNNILFFHYFGKISVINVAAIDCCMEFLEIAVNKFIIIDRENRISFR
ncbi:hypothetical protein C1645_731794 [Glomus cerebriforme]|uniref:Uncharacterized protein n=1 Tax=Glomus cerebriforme TaxID=658196 RepID=A0A397TTK1_9GLOM|nr:hypothetical protein C1645_731794 [Glomus cerebriforme]